MTAKSNSGKRSGFSWRWLRGDLAVILVVAFAFGFGLLVAAPAADDDKAGQAQKDEIWTCSMHPQIQLPESGPCPICGMDLIPLESSGTDTEIVISERARKLARIRTVTVTRAPSGVQLRLLGRLEYDETRVRTISAWTAGRIDRLYVSNVGAEVRAGRAVAAMYSPEAYAAQRDLVNALKQQDRLSDGLPVARRAADKAVESAAMRLELLGVSPRGIRKRKRASRSVAVVSSYRGTVIEQLVHEGAYVKAGQALFKIAELSTLWAQLDAYEGDLPRIRLGQKVSLEVSSLPGETFIGVVSFIDPIVDPKTRTAQVRVEVDNKEKRLSRGMFADAVVHTRGPQGQPSPMLIPRTAPLFTGKRSLVYVEVPGRDDPTYEAREIRVGPLSGAYYPVLDGLKEGERVVVAGAFVLDSDLQIRRGRSMLSLPDDEAREATATVPVDEAFVEGFATVMKAYLALRSKLAADDLAAAKDAAATLAAVVVSFPSTGSDRALEIWAPLSARLRQHAEALAKAADLAVARRSFEEVSIPLIAALQRFGNPLADALRIAQCPMALGGRAASWVQQGEIVANPYQGTAMLTCGSIEGELPQRDDEVSGPSPAPSVKAKAGHAGHKGHKPSPPPKAKTGHEGHQGHKGHGGH